MANCEKFFSTQASMMFSTITEDKVMTENSEEVYGPISIWFSKQNLPELNISQVAWWDECHIEQQGGNVGNKDYQYRFKRNNNSILDENGSYEHENRITKASFKLPEQVRFCFGVAQIDTSNVKRKINIVI